MTGVRAEEHVCAGISSVDDATKFIIGEGISRVRVVGAYRFITIVVQLIVLSVIHLIAV